MAHITRALIVVAALSSSLAFAQDEGASELAPAPAPEAPPETQAQPVADPDVQTPQQTQTQTQGAQPAPAAPVFQDQQTGPNGVPTPPPGYGTTPQPTYTPGLQPAPGVQLRQPQLDPESAARIDALMQERNQIRVGGWIAMMAAGAATTAVSVLFAVAFADVERDETGCDRCGDNTGTITFSAISIVTAAVAVTGFLMFLRRAKKRGALTRQIREIRQQAIMQRQVALLEW